MLSSISGTETEKNLSKSFVCESQARMRYNYFASRAKIDGFGQISMIFTDIENNEKEHAKRFLHFLNDGLLEISIIFDTNTVKSTVDNLKFAIAGENREYTDVYPNAANTADSEGFHEIAKCFRSIAIAEKYHEVKFLKLLNDVENDRIFKKDVAIKWRCSNCGYVYESKEAYDRCPACLHPMLYMEECNMKI
jgi:rubrerythrin